MDGSNKYECEKCGKFVDAIKRMEITELPNNLIVCLKRFQVCTPGPACLYQGGGGGVSGQHTSSGRFGVSNWPNPAAPASSFLTHSLHLFQRWRGGRQVLLCGFQQSVCSSRQFRLLVGEWPNGPKLVHDGLLFGAILEADDGAGLFGTHGHCHLRHRCWCRRRSDWGPPRSPNTRGEGVGQRQTRASGGHEGGTQRAWRRTWSWQRTFLSSVQGKMKPLVSTVVFLAVAAVHAFSMHRPSVGGCLGTGFNPWTPFEVTL